MKRVAIETHGCKLNQADSQALAARFLSAGFQLAGPGEKADVYVVNTCTVTHVADRKARSALHSARRHHPGALLVATGCYARRAPQELRHLGGADAVVGTMSPQDVVSHVSAMREFGASSGPDAPAVRLEPGRPRTRAMLKVQEGCDQVCAYCIVPRVRGRERSIPPDVLVAQVQDHVAAGYREVVLTGTQLGSYGFDLPGPPPQGLARLIKRILRETTVQRLRVSSLQPQELTDELMALWEDPRLCPHVHVPLQSGSDAVLRRMRRRYTAGQYLQAVQRVLRSVPSVAVTTDVIVGFPGESEEEFEETYTLCQRVGFAALHVFPYSPRPGTTAAHLPDPVGRAAKRRRQQRLLDLGRAQANAFRQAQVGSVRQVLWELREGPGDPPLRAGLTDNYVRVAVRSALALGNRVTLARLDRVDNGLVWASLA